MDPVANGVCLIRVEVQDAGLLLTVFTDTGEPHRHPRPRHYADVEAALAAVQEFLVSFSPGR